MFVTFRAGDFSSFSHSVSTVDGASGIFIAWSLRKELVHKVMMIQRTELLLSNVCIMIFFVVSLQCAFLRIRGLLRYMCTHAACQNYLLVDELDDVVPRDQLLRFCEAEASPSTKICVNSHNHSGDIATGFPVRSLVPLVVLLELDQYSASGSPKLSPVLEFRQVYLPKWNKKLRSRDLELQWKHSCQCCKVLSAVLHKVWFVTFDPLAGIPMIFAELAMREDWRRIFEELCHHD